MATLLRLLASLEKRDLMIRRWLEKQPLRNQESLTKLAGRGWFLGPRFPVGNISQLGRAAETTPGDVDEIVARHVRWYLDDIEAALIGFYPHRSCLFQEAFWAHREGRYSLSILAFLAQADGIFGERFERDLFRKGSKEAVSSFISEVRGRFFKAHLYPLTQSIPLWENTRYLGDNFEGLNRHQVLHGMKVDYNTELNSLKTVSLLDYLSWVLNRRDDGNPSTAPD